MSRADHREHDRQLEEARRKLAAEKPKGHHGREYAVASVSIAGEFAAVRYGIEWLAWLAAFFLLLSLIGYTQTYLTKPWLKYGSRIFFTLGIAAATYALTSKPSIVQKSDPKVIARLDEIRKLLEEQQGDRAKPDKILEKYPLGYIIFDVDYTNSVFPYQTKFLVDEWDVDWSKARLIQVSDQLVSLTIPHIQRRGGRGPFIGLMTITNPKKVGRFGGILRDPNIDVSAEILAIGEKGIVFMIGFARAPKS